MASVRTFPMCTLHIRLPKKMATPKVSKLTPHAAAGLPPGNISCNSELTPAKAKPQIWVLITQKLFIVSVAMYIQCLTVNRNSLDWVTTQQRFHWSDFRFSLGLFPFLSDFSFFSFCEPKLPDLFLLFVLLQSVTYIYFSGIPVFNFRVFLKVQGFLCLSSFFLFFPFLFQF